jgi:hypothetical protein
MLVFMAIFQLMFSTAGAMDPTGGSGLGGSGGGSPTIVMPGSPPGAGANAAPGKSKPGKANPEASEESDDEEE